MDFRYDSFETGSDTSILADKLNTSIPVPDTKVALFVPPKTAISYFLCAVICAFISVATNTGKQESQDHHTALTRLL